VPLIPLLKYQETTQISLNSKALDLSNKNNKTKKTKIANNAPQPLVASRKK